jgi:osmotically-inducible protein OsmY
MKNQNKGFNMNKIYLLAVLTFGMMTTGYADCQSGYGDSHNRNQSDQQYNSYNQQRSAGSYDQQRASGTYYNRDINNGIDRGMGQGAYYNRDANSGDRGNNTSTYYDRDKYGSNYSQADDRGLNNSSTYYDRDRNSSSFSQTEVVSDSDLTKTIRDNIGSGWFTKGYESVNVQVLNGAVTLTGTVDSQSDKEKLDKEVRDTKGVRSVNSQVTVLDRDRDSSYRDGDTSKDKFSQDKGTTPADQQLNKKIRDNVSKGYVWDSYEAVILNTSNGAVVLEGSIKNLDQQQKLIDEIQKVEGVKTVKSNLRVKNK